MLFNIICVTLPLDQAVHFSLYLPLKMAKNNPDPRFGRLSNNTPINADGIFFTSYTLGIIYAVIARGTTVLAHYACCHGNFSEVAQQVLKNIRSEDDGMLTYASGE